MAFRSPRRPERPRASVYADAAAILLERMLAAPHINALHKLDCFTVGERQITGGAMHDYEHKKLIEVITKLDEPPAVAETFGKWIEAGAHLSFLGENAHADDVVVYASHEQTFIHSLIVPNDRLSPPDRNDLMGWSCNPYTSCAGYAYAFGENERAWIDRGPSSTGSKTLAGAFQPLYGRTFNGWSGPGHSYLELNQEYAHLEGIHWRPEKRAYCRFDENGDLDPVVSVTNREDKGSSMSLVTFAWETLERYLTIADASLVRLFDFTLQRKSAAGHWPNGPTETVMREEGQDFFYRSTTIKGHLGRARGVQIIRTRRAREEIIDGFTGGGRRNQKYANFIAWDWRNQRLTRISTDPASTTNYFDAEEGKPFELSPAFFRPEVLSKYKTDRDKYTVGERELSCRAAWHMTGIDVNEAGQVHAYICYLRDLPYAEQLHWQSFNEAPKTGIAKRAIQTDFEGQFADFSTPFEMVLGIARRWNYPSVPWWTMRDPKLIDRVSLPLTASRDEWAQAFLDLSQLVVEGLEIDVIRAKLDSAKVSYENQFGTIVLLERLMSRDGQPPARLEGLRTLQTLRNKTKGHAGGSDADDLAHSAQMEHGSFTNHFQHVCKLVADDLESVEKLLTPMTPPAT